MAMDMDMDMDIMRRNYKKLCIAGRGSAKTSAPDKYTGHGWTGIYRKSIANWNIGLERMGWDESEGAKGVKEEERSGRVTPVPNES
ncbi:predicted protein [Botrytis cinerea T4]|uniref:Uncharacterized protein n=1 Tax=Botryotinia fuckeliana (strain T4) TaxID=999810 RepID=G2YJQ4_BOTF4|nr:predicted protein [Botrytis cinerea T4]